MENTIKMLPKYRVPVVEKKTKTGGTRKKKTHEEYVDEVKNKNPLVEVVGLYIDSATKITHRCLIHDVFWDCLPHNILRGAGCKLCCKEKISNKNKRTHEQYVNELKIANTNIEVIGVYINANTPILHKCLICEYEWNGYPNTLLNGCRCPKCAGNLKKSHDEYVNDVLKVNPNIEVLEKYINMKTPILHLCKIHNIKWKVVPSSILRGSSCKLCGIEIRSECLRKSHEEYVEELKEINPNIEVIEKYINISTPILHRCLKDGHEWKINPNNALSGYGCPLCNESKGERKVRQWLEKNNIDYIFQHTFDDCKNIYVLPFDFFIPSINIAIEYDGKQHFKPIEYFGGQEGFEIRQCLDNIKNEYCKNNGIKLLRIPYYKNVEEELNNFLFI